MSELIGGRELLAIRARAGRARIGGHQSLRQTEADREALLREVYQLREIAGINSALYRSAEADVSAVHALLTAQGRMLDDWAEADEDRRRELWQRLHEEADRVREVLDGAHGPADAPTSVTPATEAHGGAGEAQEG